MSVRFKIVSTGYKALEWLPRCIDSIAEQTYRNFDVVIADDASPGGAEARLIQQECRFRDGTDGQRWLAICRDENVDVLRSQDECIHAICTDDSDVIVIVDSDDFLLRPDSLEILAAHYDDSVQMTYGSYEPVPPSATCPPARPFPPSVIRKRTFRHHVRTAGQGVYYNHLRTYRYGLYRRIDPEVYFKRDGEWLRASVDTAVMLTCLELAGDRHKVIGEKLLGYNSENPLSYWRIKPTEVHDADAYVLSRPVAR